MKVNKKILGVVGGLGPYAGLDFNQKLFDNTQASKDQEHANVILISFAENIGDRTGFILDPNSIRNPGIGIAEVIQKLSQVGAEIIGIPCNTAHSVPIFNQTLALIQKLRLNVQLLNMIEETIDFILRTYTPAKKIGLLCTLGTISARLYHDMAEKKGIEILTPPQINCEEVHHAIYNSEFGIKAYSNPVTEKARQVMEKNSKILFEQGAEAVILGCTEIPLAMTDSMMKDHFVDPANILARRMLELGGYSLKAT